MKYFAVPKEIPIPEQMIKDCSAMGVVIHMRLATMKSLGKNQVVEELGGYTVLSSSIHIVTPRQMFVKRAMDIAGGLVGCLLQGSQRSFWFRPSRSNLRVLHFSHRSAWERTVVRSRSINSAPCIWMQKNAKRTDETE